jgi:hypothetical protein
VVAIVDIDFGGDIALKFVRPSPLRCRRVEIEMEVVI